MKVCINGKYYSKDDAKISVYDHGFLYGDGVFEGICFYKGRVFKLAEHLDRLYQSAHTILLQMPMKIEQMMEDVKSTVRESGLKDGYIRLLVTRGVGKLGLNPFNCSEAQVVIIVDKLDLYPRSLYDKGLTVITAASQRNFDEALSPRVKSMNYLNNIMAKMEAINAGADEALMLNAEGHVCECSGDNIFTIKGNSLYTPDVASGILRGITRDAVIDMAAKNRMQVFETTMTRYDIFNADECFLTGTAAEIIPVIKLDGRSIGNGKPGSVTRRLMDQFKKMVESDEEHV